MNKSICFIVSEKADPCHLRERFLFLQESASTEDELEVCVRDQGAEYAIANLYLERTPENCKEGWKLLFRAQFEREKVSQSCERSTRLQNYVFV